jgi:hypothetical protein
VAYTTVHKDIIFVEGAQPSAIRGPYIECDLSFKIGAQLKSLRDVKDNLVEQAKNQGYNAIVDFTYGQKSRWLAIDDVAFWGKGCLANIPQEEYKKIVETLYTQ